MDFKQTKENAEYLSPEGAFLLLSDETRVQILQELGEAWTREWPGIVSYADLMERVGAENSGRFNYHLSKLVGRYIDQRDSGYKLNFHGLRVYRTIISGTLTDSLTIEEFRLESTCFDCGGKLEASYADTIAAIFCPSCNLRYGEYPLPPRGASKRDRYELLVTADQRSRHHQSQFLSGVCPWCGSKPKTRIESPESSDLATWASTPFNVQIIHQCRECGALSGHSVGKRVIQHPAVITFYYDQGIDVADRPSWEVELVVTDRFTTIESRTPWEISVDVPLDGESLSVHLDQSLAITSWNRE